MSQGFTPKLELVFREGIGPLKLDMTRSEVQKALSDFPNSGLDQESTPELDYAFGNSLQVEYDGDGLARFIAASYYTGCGCDYLLQGQNIGQYSAAELFGLLAQLDGGQHDFNDSQYFFPKLQINVWDADTQYDYLGGEERPVYAQVGVSRIDQA
jgi:hypothetical protein